ncbi:MAG: carbohydrate kinase [Hyphomicrobiales bacterium]|nr:carbohydrate kinase [Hyphomicrobiales bacterium]
MSAPRFIAVLDVGKTNVKFAVVDLILRSEIFTATTPGPARADGPYPHSDVDAIWDFFADQLKSYAAGHPVDGISVSAHGSAIVLIGSDDVALPVLDYEHTGPDELTDEYDAARPDFTDTLSPRLPRGLNVGAQLFWLQRRFPDRFANAQAILTYPQYWLWRMTGVASNEITSIGCHTDLWDQQRRQWSTLAENQGWTNKLAPLLPATSPIGLLRADLTEAWGLQEPLPVAGGLHDSNASLVPHLIDRKPPFSVASTGTWAINFGVGAKPESLDPERDTLANINVFGEPVPAARFMGGREFSIATGDSVVAPGVETLRAVVDQQIMLLPSVVPEFGPFPNVAARWEPDTAPISTEERHCAASLYLALMSSTCLELIAAQGPTIIDGPFSSNPIFRAALASITGREVLWSEGKTIGPSVGAALLFHIQNEQAEVRVVDDFASAAKLTDVSAAAFDQYCATWRAVAETRFRARENRPAPATPSPVRVKTED